MHLDTLGEETSSIFLLHSRNHHAAPTSLPVNRRGHLASGGELEAVNHSEDFVEVSSCGGGVQERQLQPLVRTNDEHRPAGEGNALSIFLIRVHHSVQSVHLVTAQGDQLHSTLCEIIAQHLHPAQLSGTHWGVVSRVREEDSPAVLDPAVEVNVSLSCVRGEVGHNIPKLECLARHRCSCGSKSSVTSCYQDLLSPKESGKTCS